MLQLETLNLSIQNVILRFYAMMGIVIILGFMNQWLLAAVTAFVLAMSTILGVSFKWKKKPVSKLKASEKIVMLSNRKNIRMAS